LGSGIGLGNEYDELDISELEQPKSRRLLWITGVVLLAAAAGAGAALWSRRSPTALTLPTPTLQPAPPSAAPAAPPPTAAPVQPTEQAAQAATPSEPTQAEPREREDAQQDVRAHDRPRHRQPDRQAADPQAAVVPAREHRDPNKVVAPVVAPVQPARPRKPREGEGNKPATPTQDILPNPYH
jgi:cytoskeletal protein RodZ